MTMFIFMLILFIVLKTISSAVRAKFAPIYRMIIENGKVISTRYLRVDIMAFT